MSAVAETWHRFAVRRIDDMTNAIWGADLEAVQMPGDRIRGSLAFAARDGIVFSSGLIDGKENWLNLWINSTKDGKKRLNLKFKPKQGATRDVAF